MVDFELTEEQRMIRETVEGFAREEIRPAARPADESGVVPAQLVEKIWQLGLVTSAIPEQFGGGGDERSALTGAVVAEELGYGDASIAVHALAPRLFAYPILEMGSDAQRSLYLKQFASERFVPATAALMEPRFDFDLTELSTRARRDGSAYILNGSKCFVPLADSAKSLLVYAATDSSAGFKGVDAFIVSPDASGVSIGEREKNMGFKPLCTCAVTLNDVRVDRAARLGGDGEINFSRLMSEARVAISALGVGMARAAFEYARDYARERRAFGVPIATKQAVAFMLADMAIEIDASRLLVWEAAWRLDRGEDSLKESYLAKNYVAASVLKVADNAVQVLGGHGYIREHPVEMWLRNARGLAALDGIATV